MIQSFITFDSLDRTIHVKAVEQYFVFQCGPVCKFGKFINFRLGTVRNQTVKSFSAKVAY